MKFCSNGFTTALAALSLLSYGECLPLSGAEPRLKKAAIQDIEARWDSSASTTPSIRRQVIRPEWLRVLPLGASIVRGLTSNPEDGFRKSLRDQLRSSGYKVNMVGSQTNEGGSMRDGQHEGHSGHRIDQIYNDMDLSSGSKPNVYLINAGTNDCQQNYQNMDGTENRLRDLLFKAWEKSGRATIILSTLLPSDNEGSSPGANARVDRLNEKIRDLAGNLRRSGYRIVLAEMNNGVITKSDLTDGIHPKADGYRKMADVWKAAIDEAARIGFLQDPEWNGAPDDGPDDA